MSITSRISHSVTVLAVACTACLTACTTAPNTSGKAETKLPVVLIHGAWSEAAVWSRVADALRAQGHSVTAIDLPGHGKDVTPAKELSLNGYAEAVRKALPSDGKAVLVGHSMAGMVISQVAENVPDRVAKLVYVAAYLPQDGQSLYQLAMSDKGSKVGKYWRQDDAKNYSPASIASDGLVEVFCADCSPEDQRFLLSSHKAEAVPPLGTPVKLSAERFGRVPRAYIHTSEDDTVSYPLQQTMLAAAGGASDVIALKTSHMPMLTQPRALADAIAKAATN